MQKTKFCISLALIMSVAATSAFAQTATYVKKTAKVVSSEQTTTFQVLGNCGMCQRNIEQAATNAGASKAAWSTETRLLTITFDPSKTSTEAVQRAVAQAGYDNASYKAPEEAYAQLHTCCQYDRSGAVGTAKSCADDGAKKP